MKLSNNKAPGENKIPIEAFKALVREDRFDIPYEIIVRYWNDPDFHIEEFQHAKLCIILKKGDKRDINNYRGICLLDTCSKIISALIGSRLQTILKQHGMDEQNGFLNHKGCTDGTFSLKQALHTRSSFGLDSWILYIDLIKAFDTVNRKLLFNILKRYGIPPKLIVIIKKLYHNITITSKIGKAKIQLPSTVGVKQGDNLAPILFLFIIQAAMETLEPELIKANIEIPLFKFQTDTTKIDENGKPYYEPQGDLTKHGTNDNFSTFHFNRSLYADDGAILFTSTIDLHKGCKIIDEHFKKFGLLMHKGNRNENKKSKTEYTYFPSKIRKININRTSDEQHINATKDIHINDNNFISHTDTFKYLGSLITSDLNDDTDINARIKSARQMFSSIRRNVLCNKSLQTKTRKRLFLATVVNQLLWGCESWATKERNLQNMRCFYDECIRTMNHTTCLKLHETRKTMAQLRKEFDNIESLHQIYYKRRLAWFEKIAVMKSHNAEETRNPRKFLKCWCDKNDTLIFKGLGRESTTITRSYLHDLKSLNPIPKEITKFLPNRNDPFACGNLNFLIKLARDPDFNITVENRLELKEDSFKSCKKRNELK